MLPLLIASLMGVGSASEYPSSMLAVGAPGPMQYKHERASNAFHTTQAAADVFTMRRVTDVAPWSSRIQPAILPMYRDVTYRNWYTGVTTSQSSDWLILFEGSLGDRNGKNQTAENDVWASGDGGETWDLIAGISEYGRSNHTEAYGYQKYQSFFARLGATNCEDPSSDVVFSIGGLSTTSQNPLGGTNDIWNSLDGVNWWKYWTEGLPNRYYSSCDIDVSGHVYTMGGINKDKEGKLTMLNDVWTNFREEWQASTLRAPWAARAEHSVLITENPRLGRDIIYVIAGMTNTEGTQNTNDVWASSDQGANWIKLPTPKFAPRWGQAGVTTKDGVIVILGGSNTDSGTEAGMYTYRDIWASFDGATSWVSCRVPDGPDSMRDWIRTEQGATLLTDGRLMMVSGYSFCPKGECEHARYDYRDVWVSDFSLDDTKKLASICGTKVPDYIGLKTWPGSTGNTRNTFVMQPLTHNAPWSERTEPALLRMSKPVKYTQHHTGLTVSTPPEWMLMYEGSRNFISWLGSSDLENDVWASGDNGATWDLISGRSYQYWSGIVNSSHPDDSYLGREYGAQCEDPTNDDVYSLGGATYDQNWEYVGSTLVQYSEDAQKWHVRKGSTFSPARWLASCDVSNNGVLIMIAGVARKSGSNNKPYLLNDVWRAYDQASEWEYVGEAPFAPRSEHQVVIYGSDVFKTDIVYVIGGYVKYDTYSDSYKADNEVWASRDLGTEWALINEAPSFSQRWGHATLVTPSGVLLVAGGAYSKSGKARDNQSLRDLYVSLDGGYNWASCNLPKGVDYIRTNQGAQLTEDNRVLLISGYSLWTGWHRRDYKDVFISIASLDDLDALAVVCVDVEVPEGEKTGLIQWPGELPPDPDHEEEPKITTRALIVVIGVSVVVGLCITFAVWSKRATLFPSMFGGHSSQLTQMADFTPLNIDNPRLPSDAEEGIDTQQTS